jgi:alanyl-tRNA synthetase
VDCAIDWSRRFDHMQQHTGQHVLSAVFEEWFGLHTVSFHLGAESSSIDLEGGAMDPGAVLEAERRANDIVFENRPVAVGFQHAAEVQGLRKPTDREGTLRIVSIEALDRNACGGTHVRATGEVGPILLRKLERVRQTVRVEFLCGGRAVRRARADYEALSKTAQLFSAPLDEVPAWWRRSWKPRAPAIRRGASWNWTSQPARARNSTWRRSRARTACGASPGAS